MKIICIGRNYVDHIQELKNTIPGDPVIFLKPDTALTRNNQPFTIPAFSQQVHYETELVLRIGKRGKSISPRFAPKYIDSVGLGIDFTARDLQNNLKEKGLPWELSKAFDGSAVVGDFIPRTEMPSLNDLSFHLELNGKRVQEGHTSLMLFNCETIVSFVSRYFTLKAGDLIFTGTPAGVGPVKPGDRLQGFLLNRLMFDFLIQ